MAHCPEAIVEPIETILIGRRPEILDRIRAEDVALAVWQRQLPPRFCHWIEQRHPDDLPRGRILVAVDQIEHGVVELFAGQGSGGCDVAVPLISDIVQLANRFAEIFAVPAVDIRVDVISGNGCWKFHRDRVPARLVTTYRGPATQWVHPRDARQALLLQRDYTGPVFDLAQYDVALFKGSLAGEEAGIVHRSPIIAGQGISRLLCVIDGETAASPDLWRPPVS